jgi:hypothetical protein
MKLPDVILLSLSVAFIIMGIHQNMTVGFGNAYWLIMLSCVFLFIYLFRKNSAAPKKEIAASGKKKKARTTERKK